MAKIISFQGVLVILSCHLRPNPTLFCVPHCGTRAEALQAPVCTASCLPLGSATRGRWREPARRTGEEGLCAFPSARCSLSIDRPDALLRPSHRSSSWWQHLVTVPTFFQHPANQPRYAPSRSQSQRGSVPSSAVQVPALWGPSSELLDSKLG